ncbi:MAG: chorismate synthase [Promethearchaeota archaeon]|nr:MAG: chorismate synthase [Candidatus Lokiarchaeota archaeon]
MGDNTLGTRFKITSFGESHGNLIGIVVDGVPAGLELDLEFIQKELNKRRPGQSHLTTSRSESDKVKIVSGVFNGKTTGAPLCLIVENLDVDSSKYEKYKKILRPSQVDYTALKKYGGFADYRGSGRFSGRITAGFVMAGAIAKQILIKSNISVFAYTKSIGNIIDEKDYTIDDYPKYVKLREKSPVRALNANQGKLMEQKIEEVKSQKDSIGGVIKCIVNNFPVGIGGPIFNSLESNISKAIFSIPAIKGIEFGAGFQAAKMKGSEHNDPWTVENGKIQTTKNDSGGIIGGISTGMPIEFNVAVKPTATIGIKQKTVNIETMKNTEIEIAGRHDPCIVPRAIVVVEAMTAIILLDFLIIEGIIPSVFKS